MERRHSKTRVKIDSNDIDVLEKLLDILDDNFLCVESPVRESEGGGFHVFINLEAKQS